MKKELILLLIFVGSGFAYPILERTDFTNQTFSTQPTIEMNKVAQSLIGNTNAETVGRIEGWVLNASNIKYTYFSKKVSSIYVFNSRQGNCVGQSLVFASMLRQLDIPVKLIRGVTSKGWHVWAKAEVSKDVWINFNDQGGRELGVSNVW